MPGSGRSCQESSRRLSTRLSLPLDSGPERVGLGVEPGLLTLSCSLETYRVSDLDHGTEKSQDPSCPQFVARRQLHWAQTVAGDQNKNKQQGFHSAAGVLCTSSSNGAVSRTTRSHLNQNLVLEAKVASTAKSLRVWQKGTEYINWRFI